MWWTSQLSVVPSPPSTTPWRKSTSHYWPGCKINASFSSITQNTSMFLHFIWHNVKQMLVIQQILQWIWFAYHKVIHMIFSWWVLWQNVNFCSPAILSFDCANLMCFISKLSPSLNAYFLFNITKVWVQKWKIMNCAPSHFIISKMKDNYVICIKEPRIQSESVSNHWKNV